MRWCIRFHAGGQECERNRSTLQCYPSCCLAYMLTCKAEVLLGARHVSWTRGVSDQQGTSSRELKETSILGRDVVRVSHSDSVSNLGSLSADSPRGRRRHSSRVRRKPSRTEQAGQSSDAVRISRCMMSQGSALWAHVAAHLVWGWRKPPCKRLDGKWTRGKATEGPRAGKIDRRRGYRQMPRVC